MHQCIAILLLASVFAVKGRATRYVVHWDFKQTPKLAHEGLEIDVNVNDYMDLLCPYDVGSSWRSPKNTKLQIFNVSLVGYIQCNPNLGNELQICNEPREEKKLTTKFQVRSPSPLGFKFIPGASYYYISKPIGDKSKGCSKETLKMKINVKEIGEEPPRRHHEKTRTYHTIKTDHRNSSKIGRLHPLFRNTPSDKSEQSKRHHHHNKNTISTTSGTKEFVRQKVAEPVIRASQGPNKDGGNGASSLQSSQRTFSSLMMLILSSLGTLVACALLTDFDFVTSRRS